MLFSIVSFVFCVKTEALIETMKTIEIRIYTSFKKKFKSTNRLIKNVFLKQTHVYLTYLKKKLFRISAIFRIVNTRKKLSIIKLLSD